MTTYQKVGDPQSVTLTDIGIAYESLGTVVTSNRNYKKGVVFDIAQSCDALETQKTSSWWYSWSISDGFGTTPSSRNKGSFCPAADSLIATDKARDAGMDFVPMFWRSIPDRPFDEVLHKNLGKSQYLLTFNKPESEMQAKYLSPRQVADMWPEIVEIAMDYDLRLIAPCSESGGHGRTWHEDWKKECHFLYGEIGCEYDFVCLHMYYHPYPCADNVHDWACIGENSTSASNTLRYWYDTFGQKPVWVTEFACAPWGGSDCTKDHHTNLMEQLGSLLEESPIVYRYAWFGLYNEHWQTNSLNSLVWSGEKGVSCKNRKWKGAWGNNATWQIQTLDECVSIA